MATIALSAVGMALGGSIGGTVLGLSMATIGRAAGDLGGGLDPGDSPGRERSAAARRLEPGEPLRARHAPVARGAHLSCAEGTAVRVRAGDGSVHADRRVTSSSYCVPSPRPYQAAGLPGHKAYSLIRR